MQFLLPQIRLSEDDQRRLQAETAQLATRHESSKAMPPSRFMVGSRGFLPLPVPALDLEEIGELVSISYACHPIWFLRNELRSPMAHEDISSPHGRDLYLSRISLILNKLGFLDLQMNEAFAALGVIELYPNLGESHAERFRNWLTGGDDRELDELVIGGNITNVSSFLEASREGSEAWLEALS